MISIQNLYEFMISIQWSGFCPLDIWGTGKIYDNSCPMTS